MHTAKSTFTLLLYWPGGGWSSAGWHIIPDILTQNVVTSHLTQRSNNQRKVSVMPFVTKSSVSGELNYSSLLLYRKYFERFSLTLCKVKKKIRHVSNLSWDKTSSSFCSSGWTHFQIPFWKISTEPACQRRFSRSHHLRTENACCCLINHRPDCSLINRVTGA